MAGIKFTRDEVILALDVLYSFENKRVSAISSEMKELSDLLNRLPIHSFDNRRKDFRTASGIAKQLTLFRKSYISGIKNVNVGNLFLEVAFEYEDQEEKIHKIANAIRRNESSFFSLFGNILEDNGFPEGVLLGHLHRLIENRDGAKLEKGLCCDICKLQPNLYYRTSDSILNNHLVIDPVNMDFNKKYSSGCFITVCPNCHTALHHSRPWLGKENFGELLL